MGDRPAPPPKKDHTATPCRWLFARLIDKAGKNFSVRNALENNCQLPTTHYQLKKKSFHIGKCLYFCGVKLQITLERRQKVAPGISGGLFLCPHPGKQIDKRMLNPVPRL